MWTEIARLAGSDGPDRAAHHALPGGGRPPGRPAGDHRRGRVIVAEGTPDQLKSALGGDTIQVGLAADAATPTGRARAAGGGGRRQDVVAEGRDRCGPGCRRRRRVLPGVLAALDAAGTELPAVSASPGPRWTTSTCDTPVALPARPTPLRRTGGGLMATTDRPSTSLDDRTRRTRFLAHSAFLACARCAAHPAADLPGVHPRPADDLAAAVRPALQAAVASCPASAATSYLDYLTPGVVVMTAMFSAGWAGTSFIAGHGSRGDGPHPHVAPEPRSH